MARNTFYFEAGTTFSDVLTAAAGFDTMIMPSTLVNIDGSNDATASVRYLDASDSLTPKPIAVNVPVAAGDNANVNSMPRLLKAGDVLQVSGSAAGDIAIDGWTETFDV